MTAVPNASGSRRRHRSTAVGSGEIDEIADAHAVAAGNPDPREGHARGARTAARPRPRRSWHGHSRRFATASRRTARATSTDRRHLDAALGVHGHLGDAQWRGRRRRRRAHRARHRPRRGRGRRRRRARAPRDRASADRCTRGGRPARRADPGGRRVELVDEAEHARRPASARCRCPRSRCRGSRCLRRPGRRGPRHASPIPSIASDSCHMTVGMLGIAEVQAVDERERASTDAREVRTRPRRRPSRCRGEGRRRTTDGCRRW